MAVTRTLIANLALALLEARTVQNFDAAQGSVYDDLRAQWDAALDLALSDHPWNFAAAWWRDQAALPAADNPSPEFDFAYNVPAECLRVIRLHGGATFEVFDGKILTNHAGPLHVRGCRRVDETGKYSIWFAQCLAARLAELCIKSVSASEAVRSAISAMHEKALVSARSLDGREGAYNDTGLFADSFISARDGWEC
jgi:hypothetical protein